MTKRLIPARFDLYALGTRQSPVRLISRELTYWSNLDETIIGAVTLDLIDDDFGWVLLVRDRIGRFRAAEVDCSLPTARRAEAALRIAMAQAETERNLQQLGIQGDEPNAAFDLLTVSPEVDERQLHPYFKELAFRAGRAPARAVVREIGPWLAPRDPHFIREFQCTQFDQRLWELYIWAAFRELGFDVKQLESPDFLIAAPGIAFTIEANRRPINHGSACGTS